MGNFNKPNLSQVLNKARVLFLGNLNKDKLECFLIKQFFVCAIVILRISQKLTSAKDDS